MEHNLVKSNHSQTEAGKRFFTKIYKKAVANNDENIIRFCKAVFDTYDEFGINWQILKPNGEKARKENK